MNRLLYILLISTITIAGFAMYQQKDLGLVSFSFSGFSFETNLMVFTAATVCLLLVIFVLVKAIQGVQKVFVYFGSQRKHRLQEKARLSLSRGLTEYAEGRFKQAEKTLLQHVKHSDNRLPIYLSAARAAQQLDAHQRRDDYLRKAHLEIPDAAIAIGLTQAELQLAHNQNEQALATLTQLNNLSENHPYVLTLLANTYTHIQDWDRLNEILPDLKKHSQLSTASQLCFEILVCNGQLSNLAIKQDRQQLIDYWANTAAHLKVLPEIIEHYAKQLISIDAADEAEKTLRLYLDKNWQESTIMLYSELDVDVMADDQQLEMVEPWLKKHQQNAYLFLALGKICISRSFWGKASSYLESSISINPMPENYLKLARLLEENMDEAEAAQEYYRQGLHLLAGDYSSGLLQKETHDLEHETPQLKIVKT